MNQFVTVIFKFNQTVKHSCRINERDKCWLQVRKNLPVCDQWGMMRKNLHTMQAHSLTDTTICTKFSNDPRNLWIPWEHLLAQGSNKQKVIPSPACTSHWLILSILLLLLCIRKMLVLKSLVLNKAKVLICTAEDISRFLAIVYSCSSLPYFFTH